MTEKQEKAIRIIYELIGNCYITKDEFLILLGSILEKETFTPGLYPNNLRLGDLQDFKPSLKPRDTHGVELPRLCDQVIYTYNSTSTADVNPGNYNSTSTDDDIQMICEKNPIVPMDWSDN